MMSHEVTTNSELVRKTGLGSREPLVITYSSNDQCMTLFYVCFCLMTPYLIHIVDSLTWDSQPTAAQGQRKLFPNLRYLFCKAHHGLPALRGTRQRYCWGHCKQRNHQWEAQKCEEHGTKQTVTRTLVRSVRAGTRRQSGDVFDLSWENELRWLEFFATLCMSVNDQESATSTGFGVTNTFLQ